MKCANPGLRQVSIYLPEELIDRLDELIENGFYPNRAEAIRFAVADFLRRKFPEYLRGLKKNMDPTVVNYVKYHTKETKAEKRLKEWRRRFKTY